MTLADQAQAIVVGVGASRGIGAAVARRFASEGVAVWLMGRTADRVRAVADEINATGATAYPFPGDATATKDVAELFRAAKAKGRVVSAIFNAGGNRPRAFLDSDPAFVEEMWRTGALSGHIFGLESVPALLPHGGSILFTGASASLRGRAGFCAFAAAKAALRATAQSMAREFGPKGIHVAHIIIDGAADGERINTRLPQLKGDRPEDGLLSLEAIADVYWQLHIQHRSAWTHELDLRPYCEAF